MGSALAVLLESAERRVDALVAKAAIEGVLAAGETEGGDGAEAVAGEADVVEVEFAVKGMLPKGPLGRQMARKLKVYAGGEHPHHAQNPQPLALEALGK